MITVTIQEPIRKTDRREHFKIAVKYMHGDADAYSSETMFIPYANTVELEVLLRCLEFMTGPYPPSWEPREQRAAAAAFASSKTEHIDLYSRTLEDLRTRDTTDQSYDTYADIEDFKVTYFDSQNIERSVQYTLTGEQ